MQESYPKYYFHRKTFAEWYWQQIAADNTFAASMFFMDEATFSRQIAWNKHNAHIWALAIPMVQDHVLIKGVFLSILGTEILGNILDHTFYSAVWIEGHT